MLKTSIRSGPLGEKDHRNVILIFLSILTLKLLFWG